jgi:predicted DNA-binding ribbon-helix-helix protein
LIHAYTVCSLTSPVNVCSLPAVTEDDIREDTIVTTVRLRRDAHDRLRQVAADEHRTMSQEIRRLVDEHIAAYEQPQP